MEDEEQLGCLLDRSGVNFVCQITRLGRRHPLASEALQYTISDRESFRALHSRDFQRRVSMAEPAEGADDPAPTRHNESLRQRVERLSAEQEPTAAEAFYLINRGANERKQGLLLQAARSFAEGAEKLAAAIVYEHDEHVRELMLGKAAEVNSWASDLTDYMAAAKVNDR